MLAFVFLVAFVMSSSALNLFSSSPVPKVKPKVADSNANVLDQNVIGGSTVPSNGMIDYIGDTSKTSAGARWETDEIKFIENSKAEKVCVCMVLSVFESSTLTLIC